MKVYYNTEFKPGAYREYSYSEVSFDPCCKEMQTVWGEAVKFGDFDEYDCGALNTVNIAHCNAYPEGASWDVYEISFCPFCGAKIERIERKRTNFVKKTVHKKINEEIWVKTK